MYKNVIFFNPFHNGDIHVSRTIVSQIINKMKKDYPETNFFYSHPNSSELLLDIKDLKYDHDKHKDIENIRLSKKIIGDTVYISTWYGQQNGSQGNKFGCTFDCIYTLMNYNCKDIFKFSLSDISKNPVDFFPTIDYSYFLIEKARSWLDSHTEKKIFVANGLALSGQAINFSMTPIIKELSQKHKDKVFILSNYESEINEPNVFYSKDIIDKIGGSDLNENAYLTENCDVLVGRGSGVSTFALTKNNMFNRNFKMLFFCGLIPPKKGKFFLERIFNSILNYSCDVEVSNESDYYNVLNMIDSKI